MVLALVIMGVWLLSDRDDMPALEDSFLTGMSVNEGVKCVQTLDVGESGNSLTGTVYLYKDKMRYDSVMADEVQGQKDLHTISDGEYVYMWGKSAFGSMFGTSEQGMKMRVDDETDDYEPDFDAAELEASDFNVPGLNCEKWNPDESLFELPDGIEFVTLDEMMSPENMDGVAGEVPGGDASGMGGIGDMCSMCDMIPDEAAREECRQNCEI